jgi:hypothetical protein
MSAGKKNSAVAEVAGSKTSQLVWKFNNSFNIFFLKVLQFSYKVKKEVEEVEEDENHQMTRGVLQCVVSLKKSHAEMEVLEVDYKKERIVLEKKYLEIRKPFYEKRRQILAGLIEPEPLEQSLEDSVAPGDKHI